MTPSQLLMVFVLVQAIGSLLILSLWAELCARSYRTKPQTELVDGWEVIDACY